MTPHQYLEGVLANQDLKELELAHLRDTRTQIENWLRGGVGSGVRFYYGGSFAKRTMLRAGYDLDIILYFPSTERSTLQDLFNRTYRRLIDGRYTVVPRTVALRLPYNGGFHIDVVPGKAQDATFRYATLYRNEQPSSSLQTSLKVHIDSVKDAGLSDIVRLLKLWRLRHDLDLPTFALEIAVQRAMHGVRRDDLATAMLTVLRELAGGFPQARLVDPANTNNVIDVSPSVRAAVAAQARRSDAEPSWMQVVW